MIVLGADPSLAGFGYAIFDTGQAHPLVRAGVWETWADKAINGAVQDTNDRFAYVAQQLWTLANETRPERIFVEGLVYMRNTNFAAISSAARARGLVDLLAAAFNIEAIEVSAVAAKKSLGIITKKDEGLASKEEVRKEIIRLYRGAGEMIPAGKIGLNVSDAIAVVHAGIARTAFTDRLKSASSW